MIGFPQTKNIMKEELIEKILLVGEYDGKNLSVCKYKDFVLGVQIIDDNYDYSDGIDYYEPDSDWNTLQAVCKKIHESYFDRRGDIYTAQNECDIEATFEAVVEFIKFWNDETQEKTIWNNSPEWAVEHALKQKELNK